MLLLFGFFHGIIFFGRQTVKKFFRHGVQRMHTHKNKHKRTLHSSTYFFIFSFKLIIYFFIFHLVIKEGEEQQFPKVHAFDGSQTLRNYQLLPSYSIERLSTEIINFTSQCQIHNLVCMNGLVDYSNKIPLTLDWFTKYR